MAEKDRVGQENRKIRALVYAGGAVGLGIATCLIKSGVHVDIVAREDTVEALNAEGLSRDGIFGEFHAPPSLFGAFTNLSQLPGETYDYILVCCKSYDTLDAAKDIARNPQLLHQDTKIVLFQNGWGNAETFCSFFDKGMIYNARVITGFQRKAANKVTITVHAEPVHLGSLFGFSPLLVIELSDAIDRGGIPCELTDQIESDIWAKMLYNCLLNPTGAILGVEYGALADSGYTREIMNEMAREIFRVMSSAGYRTHWKDAEDFLNTFYLKLIPSTRTHRSSMLQDLSAGKRTEIDALNGAIIDIAGNKGIPVPYNASVYHMLKFLEDR